MQLYADIVLQLHTIDRMMNIQQEKCVQKTDDSLMGEK
jgi:hypothetical protein